MPRKNFVQEQQQRWTEHPLLPAEDFVQCFRSHYVNLASFAASISRFKGELRKLGAPEAFLAGLKPTTKETAEVHAKNKKQLELKCRQSVTLKNCGDNLIMMFRKYLDSTDLGELMIGLQALTGLRMIEVVCRAEIGMPKTNHNTDDVYWTWVTGVCKKQGNFPGHERPLLHRRDIIQGAMQRLRTTFFSELQKPEEHDNVQVSRKVCTRINRAIRKAWVFPEISRVTSHFFRSYYVSSTFHYFNERSSISAWASDVLAHETLETSFPYTGLLITGYGSLLFNADRSLQGMARLSI